jgi:MFS family permease
MCGLCGVATHIPESFQEAADPSAADSRSGADSRSAVVSASGVVSASPAVTASTAKGRFAAFKSADCRNYIGGASLSMMGDSIEHVISYWVLFEKFHSPALAGFAIISHWVPSLFSVYFGAWADRSDCRKIIQTAQLLFMSVSAIWGVLFLTDSLQMWHAMVLLTMHGIAGAIWAPAEQLMLHDLAGRDTLPSAVRLNSTGRSTGFLAGPALGTVLLLALGPAFGIFANVLMYLPMTIWLARTRYTGHVRDGGVARSARVSPLQALGVLREVAGQPVLISMVALGGVSSFLIGSGVQPQMPEFAIDLGVAQAGLGYGMLLSANAAGAVLGGVILESTHVLKPSVRVAMLSTIVWGACMFGFAVSQNYAVSLTLLLGAGMANLAAQSTAQTLVQLLAPSEKRGRIVGVYNMASAGLRAGSGISIGLVGGVIGIHWSLGLSSLILVVLVIGLIVYTARAAAAQLRTARSLHSTA